jgi:single-stranded DNA-binding protein
MTFSMNKVLLAGHIGDSGGKLTYTSKGTPELSFTLIVEKPAGEKVFRSYVPVVTYGGKAEVLAKVMEPADLVFVDGEVGYKSSGGLLLVAGAVQVLLKAGAGVN